MKNILLLLCFFTASVCAAGERTTKMDEFCNAQMNGLTSVELFEKGEALHAEGKHKEAALCFLKLLLPGNMRRGAKTWASMYPDLTKDKHDAMSKEEKERLAAPLKEYAEKTKKMHLFFKQGYVDKCLEAAGCKATPIPDHIKKHYGNNHIPRSFKNTMEVMPETATINKGLDDAHIADVKYYIELAKTKTGAEAVPIHIQESTYPQKHTDYLYEFYIKCLCDYSASRHEWCQKTGASLIISKDICLSYLELAEAYKALADNANAQYAAGNLFYSVWCSGDEDFKQYLSQSKEAFSKCIELEPKGLFAFKSFVGLFNQAINANEFAEAEALFARIEKTRPKGTDVDGYIYSLAQHYYKNKDYGKASALLERIRKEYPKGSRSRIADELLKRIKKETEQNKDK